MHVETMNSFSKTLQKLAGRGAADLLVSMANRKGVNTKGLGAIKQVAHIAKGGDRDRAAEIARNVRGYLKKKAA